MYALTTVRSNEEGINNTLVRTGNFEAIPLHKNKFIVSGDKFDLTAGNGTNYFIWHLSSQRLLSLHAQSYTLLDTKCYICLHTSIAESKVSSLANHRGRWHDVQRMIFYA